MDQDSPHALLADADGPPPRRSSFFSRVFLWILGMSLVMSVGSSTVYYTRQLKFLEADLNRRARSLLSNLLAQCELGTYAGDAGLLELPAQRLLGEEDVLFVAVYSASGRELIHRADASFSMPLPVGWALADQLKPKASPIFLRNDDEHYLDLYATVMTGEREPALAAYVQPIDQIRPHPRVVGVARIGLSLRPERERLREVLRWGILLGLSLLGLGAAAAYFIAGKISVPILALARGADEIRGGNLQPDIDVQRDDELGVLADSFVRMAARLRETMAQLEALNRNLEAEVQRRTRQIQHAYDFTSVLNSPIDRSGTDPDRMDAADISIMLDQALAALVEATGARGAGVFLPADDPHVDPGVLEARAACGVSLPELGPPPRPEQIMPVQRITGEIDRRERSAPRPLIEPFDHRLMVPLIFRNQPLGALALLERPGEPPDPSAVEFLRQAAAQLAIAVSNGRAYARMAQLAYELTERNLDLAAQRDKVQAQRDQLELQSTQLRAQRDQLEFQRDQLELQSTQLKEQRNKLQELNRLKSEFLASVSHELRTPLNAIIGYSELVSDGIYGAVPAEAQEALGGVLESSQNLLNLINQILDLARVEAGRMETHPEEVDVHDVCAAVVKESDVLLRDRPYRVKLICSGRPRLHTDRAKLQQILTNLVANAVKFTPEGRVDLMVTPEGEELAIAVRDTGIGIRKEHLGIIFEEFRQVDGSSTRRFGGTGLGLAIARRMAGLLGGTLTVESVFGVGSTFTLRLPAGPGARATAKLAAIVPPDPAQGAAPPPMEAKP